MKYLRHPDAPIELEKRQKKPVDNPTKSWENLSSVTKKKIKQYLLPTQSYLCAYCETELAQGENELGYHIEHIKPKSKYPDFTFQFNNLIISCFEKGNEVDLQHYDFSSLSCGHFIKNTYDPDLFIPPTEENCQNYFFYRLEGKIIPIHSLSEQDKKRALYTIDVLNLNCARLVRQRKDIIYEGLEIIDKFNENQEDIAHFVTLECAKINGRHFAFISLRTQYFKGLS